MKYCLTILTLLLSLNVGLTQNLIVPNMTDQKAGPGLRVKIVPKAYKGTGVYYSLYLPEKYEKGKQYPVIVEYTGNKWKRSGSTGEVKDANLGYAIAKKLEAIWIVLPYLQDGESITTWWGNEDEILEFALTNIRRVCEDYGGNSAEVFICGFSRGAIGVNYLGLYNEQIADVWLGFFSHDHYDGVLEWKGTNWGAPLSDYRQAAKERILRVKGRNILISENFSGGGSSFKTKQYIQKFQFDTLANIQYNLIPIGQVIPDIPSEFIPHVHTDKWLLYESSYAIDVYDWFLQSIKTKPGTYSIEGVVKNSQGKPVVGLVIDSGRTHFAITDENGAYKLEGLIAGKRIVSIMDENKNQALFIQEVFLDSNITLNINLEDR